MKTKRRNESQRTRATSPRTTRVKQWLLWNSAAGRSPRPKGDANCPPKARSLNVHRGDGKGGERGAGHPAGGTPATQEAVLHGAHPAPGDLLAGLPARLRGPLRRAELRSCPHRPTDQRPTAIAAEALGHAASLRRSGDESAGMAGAAGTASQPFTRPQRAPGCADMTAPGLGPPALQGRGPSARRSAPEHAHGGEKAPGRGRPRRTQRAGVRAGRAHGARKQAPLLRPPRPRASLPTLPGQDARAIGTPLHGQRPGVPQAVLLFPETEPGGRDRQPAREGRGRAWLRLSARDKGQITSNGHTD